MSSRRSIAWLLLFIVLAVAAHVLLSVRAGRSVVLTRPNVLVPESDRATLLELNRRGLPGVAVVRSDRWKMIAPFAASAHTEVLLRVLDALAFAPVTDVLSDAEMRRLGRTKADFGLDEPALRLTVRRDLTETTVGFGRRTPAGDGVYAVVSDQPGICVIASNVFAVLDLKPDDLRNSRLLADGDGTVAAVDVRRSSGKFVRVSQSADGSWLMQQEPAAVPVSATRVDALVKLLSEARSSRFVWPAVGEPVTATPSVSLLAGYGLDAESAVTVTLTGPGGASRSVSFGKDAGDGSVYALAQNGSAVVTVSADIRNRVLAEAESFADFKLFPVEETAVAFVSVADGDTSYLLARAPGGQWRIDSPVSAPADSEAVRALLQTILSLRTTERDPKGLVIALSTNAPAVAVSRDAVLVQNRLEDLRSKTVLKLPSDQIRRLSVTAADGRHEAAAWDAANRTWRLAKPDGATLNGLALAGVLSALDPLMAQSVARLRIAASEAGNYGLERPRFTLAIDPAAEGAVRRNVLIGAPAPDGGAYATVGSTDAIVILSEATVKSLTASFSSKE